MSELRGREGGLSRGGKLQILNRGSKEVKPFIGSSYGFQGSAEEGDDVSFSLRELSEGKV